MISELFSIGSFSSSPFGWMMALAFLGGYAVLSKALIRIHAGTDDDASAILLGAGVAWGAAKLVAVSKHSDPTVFSPPEKGIEAAPVTSARP